jgi:hypothetical protein
MYSILSSTNVIYSFICLTCFAQAQNCSYHHYLFITTYPVYHLSIYLSRISPIYLSYLSIYHPLSLIYLSSIITYLSPSIYDSTEGHIRVGPHVITDPAFLVTRTFEDYVTWVDSSKIKRTIMKYNDKLDDYDLLGN